MDDCNGAEYAQESSFLPGNVSLKDGLGGQLAVLLISDIYRFIFNSIHIPL